MLIDLKLPGRHGFELCRLIRQASDVPIVIVTAQIDDVDMVAGLEAGADDYVTKPFTGKVLTARLRALLRRAQGAADHTGRYVFGDVEVSPREGEVRKAGASRSTSRRRSSACCVIWPSTAARFSLATSCCSGFGDTRTRGTADWSTRTYDGSA